RRWFFCLTIVRRWKKWLAVTVVMLTTFITLVLPIFGVVQLLVPKISYAIHNPEMFVDVFNKAKNLLTEYFAEFKVSEDQIQGAIKTTTYLLTKTMTGTAHVLINVLVAFFLL